MSWWPPHYCAQSVGGGGGCHWVIKLLGSRGEIEHTAESKTTGLYGQPWDDWLERAALQPPDLWPNWTCVGQILCSLRNDRACHLLQHLPQDGVDPVCCSSHLGGMHQGDPVTKLLLQGESEHCPQGLTLLLQHLTDSLCSLGQLLHLLVQHESDVGICPHWASIDDPPRLPPAVHHLAGQTAGAWGGSWPDQGKRSALLTSNSKLQFSMMSLLNTSMAGKRTEGGPQR